MQRCADHTPHLEILHVQQEHNAESNAYSTNITHVSNAKRSLENATPHNIISVETRKHKTGSLEDNVSKCRKESNDHSAKHGRLKHHTHAHMDTCTRGYILFIFRRP